MNNFFYGKSRAAGTALLLLAALIALLFFLRSRPGPFHALPSQTAIALEFDGLQKAGALQKNIADTAWAAVLETALFRNTRADAAAAERLFRHDEALRRAFAERRLIAGFTLHQSDSLHGLLVLDAGMAPDVQKLLKTNAVTQKIFPSVFHGHTLYTVHLDKRERMVVAAAGNLLLFSRFSALVEDAISQLQGGDSWWADRALLPELDAAGPLKLFFRPAALASQYEHSMAKDWEHVPEMLRQNLEWLGIAWNGQSVAALAETSGFLSSMGAWDEAASQDIFEILPDNTALSGRAFFGNTRVFFGKIKDSESADFEQFVMPWAGTEAAWVLTEPFSPGMRDDQFIVLAVRDSALALESLRAYGRERGVVRKEDYQTFEIFEFLSPSLLSPLTDETNFRNPSCVMLGRYVVFGNTRSAIELWVDKYIVSQTAAHNADFLQLRQQFPETAGAQVLLNAVYLPLLLKNLFGAEARTFNDTDIQTLTRTGFIGVHARSLGKNRLTLHITAQPHRGETSETSILWKTPLAALATSPPYVVAPGAEGGGAAILIQDARHELYRLNADGVIVWHRHLQGPILGAVQGIDFWGNQTVCYLFNTADRIWLLDDKGRDVEGFPLELQSPATNGVIAVDFDKNLKFNYFVACSNGNLYGYDQFGRPLPGWNPQSGTGRIVHPAIHFQRGNKDYLAALNQAGKLFVFGRNGAARFPAVQLTGKQFGPLQADAASKSPRIVAANGTGTVFVCNLEGAVFNLQFSKAGSAPAALVFAPLGGDPRFGYAVLKGKNLSASGYEGAAIKTLFQTELPATQDTLFAVAGQRLGVLNRKKRQVLLSDSGGNIHPDFPLAGTTPFVVSDLFRKAGQQILVVGDGSSVYAYKIR